MMKNSIRTRPGPKSNCVRTCLLSLAAGGIASLITGCVVEPMHVGFRPVVVAAPEPVYYAPEPVMVPDSYVWDGYENVGMVGGAYFYLGAGNVWLSLDPYRMERFHGWEGGHAGWRDHAIRNDRFRNDRNGHGQPKAAPKKHQEGH